MKHVTLENATPQPPKLLDQLRRCIRDNQYGLRTERAYVYWARWYIHFHGLRHLMEMVGQEIQHKNKTEIRHYPHNVLT